MTEEQQAAHDRMLELLDDTWELSVKLQADLPLDERRSAMRALRDNVVELEPLLEAERNREFYELGRVAGYDEAGAVRFTEYLTNVLQRTSLQSLVPAGRRWTERGPMGPNSPPRGETSPSPTPETR
jgi:hypothetical protein